MSKIKSFILLATLLCAVMSFTACSSDDNSSAKISNTNSKETTVTVTLAEYDTVPDKSENAQTTTVNSTETEAATTTTPKVEATTTVTTTKTPVETTVTAATTTTKKQSVSAKTTTTKKQTASVKTTTTKKKTSTAKTTTTTKATTTKPVTTTTINAKPLSNKNASKEAVKLYSYICRTYGNKIISGQQESTWMGSDQYEFDYIYSKTGKYPAIRGLDYMNDDFYGVNKRAKEWYNRGGIVTICWHCGSDFSGSWSESMNTEISDWDKALTEGTDEYNKLIKGMDKAAEALKELEAAGIPVLWRPFHELDGAWFWWGKGGADNFVKLWRIMYDRYTNYHGLDNLIWVLGYSGNGRGYASWYPGDDYVDIVGADSYNDGSNANLYNKVNNVVGYDMPICFHECGKIPTVSQLIKDKAKWVWFMTWHTDYITNVNRVSDLKAIYNDDYVITLDELPNLK